MAAIDDGGASLTYAELAGAASAFLRDLGGTSPNLILLEADNSIASLVAYVAAQIGKHPVLLCRTGDREGLERLRHAFCPDAVVRLVGGKPELELLPVERRPELHPELAVLLSTSGSTGSPKCVRLSRRNIWSNARSIGEYLSLGPADRGLANLPFHYSYGLSIVNSHLAAGATLLLTSRSVIDPDFWRFAADRGATSFAGVPHTYELLDRIGLADHAPATLRYFTQAGGRLPPEKVRAYAALAKERGWQFYVMYGQTEATARMAYLPPGEALTSPAAIGIPIPGGRFELRDPDGAKIDSANSAGELFYEGPNVMMGYAAGRNELAAPPGPSLLATGDLALLNDRGLYEITGRLSRFIKIFGNRIGLDDVEALLAREGRQAVATGVDNCLIVATREADDALPLGQILEERLKLPPDYFRVSVVDEYPRLPNGKIDYGALKAAAPDGATGGPTPQPGGAEGLSGRADDRETPDISTAYREVFGDRARDREASFTSLGGDSLNYVVMAMKLEPFFAELPKGWEALSIEEMTALAAVEVPSSAVEPFVPGAKTGILTNTDTLRGLACLLVVVAHVVGMDAQSGLRLSVQSEWRHFMDGFDLVRMPLFAALAGYLFSFIALAPENYGPFVRQRAKSLIIPAIFATFVIWTIRTAIYGPHVEIGTALAYGYLHLWYLYALMIVLAVAGFLASKVRPGTLAWVGLGLVLVFVQAVMPKIHLLSIDGAVFIFPFFIFGMLLNKQAALLRGNHAIAAGLILSLGVLVWQQFAFEGAVARIDRTAPLGVLASCAMIICLFRYMPRLPWIEQIAIYSYSIYLWHPVANAGVRAGLSQVFAAPVWLLFCAGTAAGILAPILLHRAVMRFPTVSLPFIGR